MKSAKAARCGAGAHVIATQEQDLVSEVNRITAGAGARMAFDPVGGPEVANVLRALSYLGIFFQYGALDTADMSIPVMEVLGKDLTIRGYQLFEITQDPERLDAKSIHHQGPAIRRAASIDSKRSSRLLKSSTPTGSWSRTHKLAR